MEGFWPQRRFENILEPLRNLLEDGELGPRLEETARIIYSNQSITVNAAVAAAAVAAGVACKYQVLICHAWPVLMTNDIK